MADPYTQLLEWRRSEAAARGLAKLPHEFYPATQNYLAELRKTFEFELRENPSGKKGELARQTYQRATQVARDVIEARMTKILSLSFQAAVGGARELPNALPEERTLFDQLLRLLRGHRTAVAPFLEPTGPPPSGESPSFPVLPDVAAPPAPLPAPAGEGTHGPVLPPVAYVRVLKDGRPIEVLGETVDLRKEDVLTLPPETARLLVTAKVAEMILPAKPKLTT
ncbi:MAG: DNA replication complex GINS family protein [Thermoplasmata archaeon]|nr:DNA replication complex GINS family protein [Thermoplasmata archaeon]